MEAIGEELNPSLSSPLLSPIPIPQRKPNFSPFYYFHNSEIFAEVRRQLKLAGPLVAVTLLQYFLQVISIMFVGHLGELSLSGASMATSFANVSGFSVLLGMGSALDTLCGQAYGAKQYHMLGIHMQRAMLVLLLVSMPLALVWAYTSQILMAVGQNPEISTEAGLYARWLIPGLFAYGLLQCHVRFLQNQNIVFPMLITSGITTLFHIFACWVLVYKSGLGNKGAALATSISYWISVLLLAVYIKFSQACKKTWNGVSQEALHHILNFIELAIPSAFMTCLEYWSFEMVVLLSGLLPNPKLETSVLSISLNTMWMVYMVPTGFSSVVSIRVSNELGGGRPQAARQSVQAIVIITVTEGLLVALASILLRDVWGYLYSNEEEVVKYVSAMMPVLATSNFLDGIQCALSGAARGCGWQKFCSYINLGAYYIVGIPSAILFAFVLHVGGEGLWMGILCALTVQVLVLLVIIMHTDWDCEAARLAVHIVVGFAIVEALVVGSTMVLVRNVWGYAYSNEVEVVKYVAIMMPILASSNFLDGIKCLLSGCGWQKIGAFINLGAYYIVGIPSAILLAFVLHIGRKGLWLGIICDLFVQVLLLTITLCTDWEKEASPFVNSSAANDARKARDRVYNLTILTDMAS